MSFYYMSLHAEAFMQHELAMRLQLLAPKILVLDLSRQRRISEVIKNRRQQKRKRRPLHAGRKSTVRLQHRPPPGLYTTVNDPHRELQNYSSCPITLLVLTSRIWFLILLQRCTTTRPLVSLPFEY